MENTTPFADAISGDVTTNAELTQIEILRKSNHELKLQVIELKQDLKKHSRALELIDNMKEVVHHMPEAENMSALSELVKASTGAIDTLNKIVLQDKKSNTTIKAKKMDIESKKELQQSDQKHSLTMSREEVIASLLNHKDVINVEAEVKEPDKLT